MSISRYWKNRNSRYKKELGRKLKQFIENPHVENDIFSSFQLFKFISNKKRVFPYVIKDFRNQLNITAGGVLTSYNSQSEKLSHTYVCNDPQFASYFRYYLMLLTSQLDDVLMDENCIKLINSISNKEQIVSLTNFTLTRARDLIVIVKFFNHLFENHTTQYELFIFKSQTVILLCMFESINPISKLELCLSTSDLELLKSLSNFTLNSKKYMIMKYPEEYYKSLYDTNLSPPANNFAIAVSLPYKASLQTTIDMNSDTVRKMIRVRNVKLDELISDVAFDTITW